MSAPALGRVSRRNFLRAGAATASGLWLGFALPSKAAATSNKLNAFVHVGTDDTVTLFIHKAEMGQGTVTSLSQLLAEELECDWTKIRTEFAGVNREYGPMQGVFGSQSVRTSYDSLRRAGAAAREMLVQAAAKQWNVAPASCRAENGIVVNTSNNARLTYGALAEAASKLTAPASPALKDPSQYRILGKPVKRLDTPSKVDGSASFGIDVRISGMLYANVARCPVFGGKVKSFDAAKAKAVPGVKQVVQISNGVAVVGDTTWSAMQGRRVLDIHWDEGPVAAHSTPDITQSFIAKMSEPGQSMRKIGDAEAALAGAAKKIEAVYQVPYLAHAPMEPLNCTADVKARSVLRAHSIALIRPARTARTVRRSGSRRATAPHSLNRSSTYRSPRPRRWWLGTDRAGTAHRRAATHSRLRRPLPGARRNIPDTQPKPSGKPRSPKDGNRNVARLSARRNMPDSQSRAVTARLTFLGNTQVFIRSFTPCTR